jgi:uracil-DNA glycosylase family 4
MKPKAPHALCSQCPFQDRAVALTTGPANAKIAVVSRSPGHYEALQGKSFAGPSGKVLDHLLALQGTDRTDVLATNVVLCQSDGTESGFGRAVACCAPRLDAEIAGVDTVVACGVEAHRSLLDKPGGIHGNRGYVHYRDSGWVQQQRVIVTNNPAVVIRDDRTYPELVRDFRLAINPIPTPKLPKVRVIDSVKEAEKVLPEMLQAMKGKLVASDIETRGERYDEIVVAGFATRPTNAVVFGEEVCTTGTHILRQLYQAECRYLWHNGKYDVSVLRRNGIPAQVDEDSMLLSWCLDERPGNPESGAGGHSLEWLLKDFLGWPKYESDEVKQFKKDGINPGKKLYQYNGLDTAGTLALFEILEREAKNDNVWDKPYRLMLIRLSETLTRMELEGNRFDVDKACDILEEEVWPKLRDLKKKMREQVVRPELNPNSHKQITELFYDTWNVSHNLKRPKIELQAKRSCDKSVREEILRGDFRAAVEKPFVERFVKALHLFKELDTQRGTFFEGMVKKAYNGRLYTDFKIHGTESGRISSANPNLQNVTRPKEGIPSIRSCFLPDDGCVLISADLSQAELRTIAVLSGDDALRSIYLDSTRSLHREVAAEFYGDNYTYEQYVRAKNINFGVAYWQSAFTFAQMYNMPQKEADEFIKWWWRRFPKVWDWTKATEEEVMNAGELQSPFGHKRRFYVIPADEGGRLHVVKQGINFRPQNIAANITLWGLIRLAERLDWRIAQPRITVHDSILINCREEHIDEVAHLMKECLENAALESIEWSFPYRAELSIGYDWGNLEEYESPIIRSETARVEKEPFRSKT